MSLRQAASFALYFVTKDLTRSAIAALSISTNIILITKTLRARTYLESREDELHSVEELEYEKELFTKILRKLQKVRLFWKDFLIDVCN